MAEIVLKVTIRRKGVIKLAARCLRLYYSFFRRPVNDDFVSRTLSLSLRLSGITFQEVRRKANP